MARLADYGSGREIVTPIRHDGRISAAAFDPQGLLFAIVDGRGRIHLWDAETGRPVGPPFLLPNFTSVQQLAFSPDGRKLYASASLRSYVFDLSISLGSGSPSGLTVLSEAVTKLRVDNDGNVRRIPFEEWKKLGDAYPTEEP